MQSTQPLARESVREFWPLMNADERGLKTKKFYRRSSAFIGGPTDFFTASHARGSECWPDGAATVQGALASRNIWSGYCSAAPKHGGGHSSLPRRHSWRRRVAPPDKGGSMGGRRAPRCSNGRSLPGSSFAPGTSTAPKTAETSLGAADTSVRCTFSVSYALRFLKSLRHVGQIRCIFPLCWYCWDWHTLAT